MSRKHPTKAALGPKKPAQTTSAAQAECALQFGESEEKVTKALAKRNGVISADFNLQNCLTRLARERKQWRKHSRRKRLATYTLLTGALTLVLAAYRHPWVHEHIVNECEKGQHRFQHRATLLSRVLYLYVTKDPQRRSDYAQALLGAIRLGLSPKRLYRALSGGKASLASLKAAALPPDAHVKSATRGKTEGQADKAGKASKPKGREIKLGLSALTRLAKLNPGSHTMLAVVTVSEQRLMIHTLAKKKAVALKRFRKLTAAA